MSVHRAKVPRIPPQPLDLRDDDVVTWSGPLWRIHRTSGVHPSSWNAVRSFGPIASMRWEPHPLPKQEHAAAHLQPSGHLPSVSYTASTPATAFAEVFQQLRIISLEPDRTLSAWEPSRELELLDLTGSDFAIRNGAAHALNAAPKSTCRAWTREIFEQCGQRIDGLHTTSTLTGEQVIVLLTRAADAFPAAPAFSRPLDHLDVAGLALRAGRRFGWPVA